MENRLTAERPEATFGQPCELRVIEPRSLNRLAGVSVWRSAMREQIADAIITLLNAGADPDDLRRAIQNIAGVDFIPTPAAERVVN